jgi:hypothetical protein
VSTSTRECEHCYFLIHKCCHINAALAAYDAELEYDQIAYSHDHPAIAVTLRPHEEMRMKKAKYGSPRPGRA